MFILFKKISSLIFFNTISMYYLNQMQIEKQSRYMIIFNISSDQNLRVIRKDIFYIPDAIHSVAISFITVDGETSYVSSSSDSWIDWLTRLFFPPPPPPSLRYAPEGSVVFPH